MNGDFLFVFRLIKRVCSADSFSSRYLRLDHNMGTFGWQQE
jgi:hypothetical protein